MIRIRERKYESGLVRWQADVRGVATDEVASTSLATGTLLDLSALDLRIEPGDVLVVALTTASSTAVCNVGINWQER